MVFLVSKKGENTKVIVVLMMIKEEIIHNLWDYHCFMIFYHEKSFAKMTKTREKRESFYPRKYSILEALSEIKLVFNQFKSSFK